MTQKSKKLPVFCLGRAYIYSVAALCLGVGVLLFSAAFGPSRYLTRPDVLAGINTQVLLILAAVFHLVLCASALALRDPIKQSFLPLWVAWLHGSYWVGVIWLTTAGPVPVVVLAGRKLGIGTKGAALTWKLLIAYLVVGGLLHLLAERRRLKRAENEQFMEKWRETRDRHVASPHAASSTPNHT